MAVARRSAGMDQATLAGLVSRNRVTLSDIERGKLQPGQELANSIARALGVEVVSLYWALAEPPASTGAIGLTIDELQVIEAMRRLSPVPRAKIWAFAQGLAAGGSAEGASAAADLAGASELAAQTQRANSDTQADSA